MKKLLSVAAVAALLVAQQGPAFEAAAQSFRFSVPSEGGNVVPAVTGGVAPLAGGVPALNASVNLSPSLLAPAAAPAFTAAAARSAAIDGAAALTPTAAAASVPALAAPSASASALSNSAAAADGAVLRAAAPKAAASPVEAAKSGLAGLMSRVKSAFAGSKDGAPKAAFLQGDEPGLALAKTFDGSAAKKETSDAVPSEGAPGALSHGKIQAYLVRAGQKPVAVNLNELSGAAAGEFAAAFNQNGHMRVILGEGGLTGPTLSDADVEGLKETLRAAGLRVDDKRARVEAIPYKATAVSDAASSAAGAPSAAPAASKSVWRPMNWARAAVAGGIVAFSVLNFGTGNILATLMVAGLVASADRVVRELGYAAGMLKVAFKESKSPRWNEILGGVVGKIIPAIVNIGIFAAMYHSHPWALVLASALSLAVETFHGVWVNAWDTFQSKIGRHRGMLFQNLFNFVYGQMISGSFRLITFLALGNVPPPWSIAYWKDVSVMTIVGTFCGTLGYRGLNSIYEKGRVPRWGRAAIQQLRDFCMMMIGPFFGTGNMFMTWVLFGVMQSVDVAIFLIDHNLKTRPIVYLADERVAQSDAFQKIYVDRPSPLKEAADAAKNFILIKPFVAAFRWARARLAKGKPAK